MENIFSEVPVIVRSEKEIYAMIHEILARSKSGQGSKFRGQTYEDGIITMYDWLIGEVETSPMV